VEGTITSKRLTLLLIIILKMFKISSHIQRTRGLTSAQ